jgi:hypothetical protein
MVAVAQIRHYMATGSAPPGRVLARIAARQHGVVSREQLVALGRDLSFAGRELAAGRLHPIHLGVYAVGHRNLTREGRWMAAVLAGGERALLSHFSAALLWRLIDRAPDLIHVLVPGPSGHRRAGLIMHRTRFLPPEHRAQRGGIPVTSPHRTLIDIAALLPAERLRFAVEAADRRGLLDVPALVALCGASRGKRGVGTLHNLALEQRGAIHRTKSPPEASFLRGCLTHGLPEPLVNTHLHGYEVDFFWPVARLVVEIDSYTYHRSWAQRQRDLDRDADLKVRGIEVLRMTGERLHGDEDGVFAQLATLLAMRTA